MTEIQFELAKGTVQGRQILHEKFPDWLWAALVLNLRSKWKRLRIIMVLLMRIVK